MRKILSLLLLTLLSTGFLYAQKKSPGKKHLNWGVTTGFNVSKLNIDNINDESNWRVGYVLGAFFRINAGTNFMVQPELLYSSMGDKVSNTLTGETTYRLNYFSIPVLARYQFTKKWAAVAGPQFDFLIEAKAVNNEVTSKVSDNYKDNSINGTAGIEFWPSSSVGLRGRYIHGFTDISENGNPAANNVSMKNQAVQFTIAIKL